MNRLTSRKMEWSWDDLPILLPLAFEAREWNAVYTAFYLAESTGSLVRILHVKTGDDEPERRAQYLDRLKDFSSNLKVTFKLEDVQSREPFPSISEIAESIVQKSEEFSCGSIVMSAHREDFFTELFGRISDRVARTAKCRVVLVETPKAGLQIPKNPSKILIPALEEELDPEPFILAGALTSSASVPNVEILVTKIVQLPPSVPLDAVNVPEIFRREEQEFSSAIGSYIQSLGRFLTPRILPVRRIGQDVATYATDLGVDMIILSSRKTGHRSLLPKNGYEIVSRAPCISLVVVARRTS